MSPGSPVDEVIGRQFGSYRVTQLLGRGGMGSVYLAEQPRIGKRVAIKVLHKQFARNTDVLERFFQEAKLVNAIRNEHIIDVLDFGETDQHQPFLVMELLEGESLTRRIERRPLEEAAARHIGSQVARTLGAAHAIDVVHCDLKPDNIFITRRGKDPHFVKLLDFGAAELWRLRVSRDGDSTVVGTPSYMAPEQILCQPVSPSTDVYALGCILFEMVAGRPPFGAPRELQEVIQAHLHEPPPRLRQLAPVSAEYEQIVLACLKKAPEARFNRALELASALESSLSLTPTPMLSLTTPLEGPPRPPVAAAAPAPALASPALWQRGPVRGAAAGLAVLLLIVVGLALRGSPAPATPVSTRLAPVAPGADAGAASPAAAATGDAAARTDAGVVAAAAHAVPEAEPTPTTAAEPAPTAQAEPEVSGPERAQVRRKTRRRQGRVTPLRGAAPAEVRGARPDPVTQLSSADRQALEVVNRLCARGVYRSSECAAKRAEILRRKR